VWDPWVKGSTAQVNVGLRILGGIDPQMLFTKHSTKAVKEGCLFKLVLTQKHWEVGPDGGMREVSGPIEWKIDGTSDKIWLTVDTAIRYVIQKRDKATDGTIKKNADQTLVKLQGLH
jgi:hypothetical protein